MYEIMSVENKIIQVRNLSVILDSDVAKLYGTQTKEINKAVKNNPDKFPKGYVFNLKKEEKIELEENFLQFNKLKHSSVLPKAFTEKGLYMLATILKSSKAIKTTINIIETFSKIKELSKNVHKLQTEKDKEKQKSLTKRSGEIIAEILDTGKDSESETSIELNLAVLKFKHTIKNKKK